jgi:hypothetical protein
MLITKVTKNQNIDFNGNFNIPFYQKLYELVNTNYLNLNTKIVDNAIK